MKRLTSNNRGPFHWFIRERTKEVWNFLRLKEALALSFAECLYFGGRIFALPAPFSIALLKSPLRISTKRLAT